MDRGDGLYVCANWCNDGTTTVRGEFCIKCKYEEALYLIKNRADRLVDTYNEDGQEMDSDRFIADFYDLVFAVNLYRSIKERE